MKTTTIAMLLLAASMASFGQGKMITAPHLEYGADKVNAGIGIGLEHESKSYVMLGINQTKAYEMIGNPNFTGIRLSSGVYLFKGFPLAINLKADGTRGEFLDSKASRKAILCEVKGSSTYGKVIGYEKKPSRNVTERNRLTGTIGLSLRLQRFVLYSDYTFDDYNANNWYNDKKDPFGNDVIKVGASYIIDLKKFL